MKISTDIIFLNSGLVEYSQSAFRDDTKAETQKTIKKTLLKT